MAEVDGMEGSQLENAILDGPDCGIEPEGLRDHEPNSTTGNHLTNPNRLPHIDGHRFFQKDVFASICRLLAYCPIEGWRKGHHYSIDGIIG